MRGWTDTYDGRHAAVVFLVVFAVQAAVTSVGILLLLDARFGAASTSRALVALAQDRTWFGLVVGTCVSFATAHFALPVSEARVVPPLRAFASDQLPVLPAMVAFAWSLTAALEATARGERGVSAFGAPIAFGVVLGLLAIRSLVRSLHRLPAGLIRPSIGVVVVGFLAIVMGSLLFDACPTILQRWTLRAVDAVVRVLYADATSDLARQIVGTHAFRVRIYPSCSGVEGMTLGVLLVAPYLYLARRELRFPQALVLLPCIVLALGIANVARIVLFISVGRHAARAAADAFHSSIGWFLFVATISVTVPVVERVLNLRSARRTGDASGAAVRPDNPAVPYLVPFIVSSTVVFAVSMMALDASHLALLRYAFAAVALFAVRRRIRLGPLSDPRAWLGGVLVAILYVAATPMSTSASPLVALTFGGHDSSWKILHFVGFGLVTPMVEELAFRGYLLRRFGSPSFDDVAYRNVSLVALVLTSALFGAMHDDVALATLAGLVFGLVARTCGLGGAVVAHSVANAAIAVYAVASGHLGVVG